MSSLITSACCAVPRSARFLPRTRSHDTPPAGRGHAHIGRTCIRQRAHVRPKRIIQYLVRASTSPLACASCHLARGHDQGFRVRFLAVEHGKNHRSHFAFDIVRLVDHVGDAVGGRVRRVRLRLCRTGQFVINQEEFVGIHTADNQIVVRVLAIVEMKAAEVCLRPAKKRRFARC